jgi:hypothetical protein
LARVDEARRKLETLSPKAKERLLNEATRLAEEKRKSLERDAEIVRRAEQRRVEERMHRELDERLKKQHAEEEELLAARKAKEREEFDRAKTEYRNHGRGERELLVRRRPHERVGKRDVGVVRVVCAQDVT